MARATREPGDTATGTFRPTVGEELPSWNDGAARRAILGFVAATTEPGRDSFVPPEERVAVFDNDGTLWCEKPMPIELGFILERLDEMAARDPALRERQPWKAARERDYAWLGGAIERHYAGDDRDVEVLMVGVLQAFAGTAVDAYGAAADAYVRATAHPTLHRPLRGCGYLPMIELLRALERHGFACYIASGGNRDFMRGFAEDVYGIPPERVIGSSNELRYHEDHGGSVVYRARPDVFDDGPAKPVRIWSRIGRRPIVAVGNSNGDIPMLEFAGGPGRPALRLLVRHDDARREFAYDKGAEAALGRARAKGWTVVSVKDDWETVFAEAAAPGGRGAA